MEKIIITIAAVILAMGGMAVGSAVDSNSIVEDGIEYSIKTDKAVYSLGENVQMLYRVTNLSEDEVEFIFTYGPLDNTCDWMVDKDELRIWDNLGRPGTAVMTSFNLSPSTSYEYTHTWNMTYKNGDDILPGNYNVTGVLGYHPDHERYVSVSVQIEIIPEPAMIYYVDDDATGANDGSSWADAYNYLQDALSAASSGDEIWLAKGIYKADQGTNQTSGDRTATFQLINGVTLKGGYAGFGEPNPNARDIDAHQTILSGDLSGDDVDVNDPMDLLGEPTRAENNYHVVTSFGADETAVLDGFTITAGNANWELHSGCDVGAGMYNSGGSPNVTNCMFTWNSSRNSGGGMYNYRSNPTMTNCTFSNNGITKGGGMYNHESSPILVKCIFTDNVGWGFPSTHFISAHGGGMYNNSNSEPTLNKCTFSGNSAYEGGGMYNDSSSPTLTNCTFSANSADWGGGILSFSGDPMLINCAFSGNSADKGGGTYCSYSDPIFINCTFSGNSSIKGGAMYNDKSNLMLKNCTFAVNSAPNGNAVACDSFQQQYPSSVQVTNCILWDGGNEIWNNDNSVITITYSDVQGGWPGEGNIDADPFFVAPGYWDANSTPGPGPGPPVALDIPYFLWVDGDYHLLADSPCIDAGDPNYVAEPNETDLDGRPRVVGGRIDMGAYEYSPLIPAEVKIVPRTINLASKGKWITCYIWLPEEYDVSDIDPNRVLFECEIEVESFQVDEEEQIAVARFNREHVQTILNVGEHELTISVHLMDGTAFEGRDVIKVIDKGRGK